MHEMRHVKTYRENGRTFWILQDEHGYWGIEDKYIENGKLTREFNGISRCLCHTAEETIRVVSGRIRIDAMKEAGMSDDAILKSLFDDLKARV